MTEYDKIKECSSVFSWIYYSWNYICGCTGKREEGLRFFGSVYSNGGCICGRNLSK